MSKRCSCYAVTTGKKCKNKFSVIICNKKYCTLHAHITFDKSAAIIQKGFQGWKVRQKMKNIFYPLPDELQRKIIFHMRESLLIKKHHHKVLQKILDKRFHSILANTGIPPHGPYNTSLDYYLSLISLYNLFTKYLSITSEQSDRTLILHRVGIVEKFRSIFEQGNFYPLDQDLALNIYHELLHSVMKYNKQFCITYDINY